MRSRKHPWMLAILVLALVSAMLFVAACEKEETATTATGETTATTAAEEGTFTGEDLVIGAINSMTGSNALTGAEQKWAQEQAVADKNAAGGITLADGSTHKVVLQFADDTSSDTGAAAAMEKLIKTDGLKIVLSSNTTPYNQAAATVAEQNQAYFHINTSWTDEAGPEGSGFAGFIGGMDLQWSTDIFESAADSGLVALHGADSLPAADQPTKWAVMTDNTPDGVGFGNSTQALLEGAGKTVVTYEQFVEGTSDFSSIIMKFQEEGVDAVVTLIAPTDGITFVRQCREQNWAPKYMFGFKGFWPVEFYAALGSDADYICHDGFWTENYPYPGALELGQAFRDAHDGDESVTIGLPYAAAQILFMAIERAGVFEPGAVRDEVFNGTFEGTTMGDITYNDQGIADIPFLAYQWKDANHPVIWPEEYATIDTQLFKPWDER